MNTNPGHRWMAKTLIVGCLGVGALSVWGLSPRGRERKSVADCTRESLAQAIEQRDEAAFTAPRWEELSLTLSTSEEALRRILVWDDASLSAGESELTSALTSASVILIADTHDRPHAVDLALDTIQRVRARHGRGRWPGSPAVALEALPTSLAEKLGSIPLARRVGYMRACLRGCWSWKCDPYDRLLALSTEPDVRWMGLGPIMGPLPALEHLPDSERPFAGAVTWSEMEQNILVVDQNLDALLERKFDEGTPSSQLVVVCGAAHIFRSAVVATACASGRACLLVCGFPEWEWAATQRTGAAWGRAMRPFRNIFRVPPVGGLDRLCGFYKEGAPRIRGIATIDDASLRLCVERVAEAYTDLALQAACSPLREGTVAPELLRSAVADRKLSVEQLVALIWAVRLGSWTAPAAEDLFQELARVKNPIVRSNLIARWGGLDLLPAIVRRECVAVLLSEELEEKTVRQAAAMSLGRHLLHPELVIPILMDDILLKGPPSVVRSSLGLLARFGVRSGPWLSTLRSADKSVPRDLIPVYLHAIDVIQEDGVASRATKEFRVERR